MNNTLTSRSPNKIIKYKPQMSKVNLDALIPRDDFTTTTYSDMSSDEQFNNIGIKLLHNSR